MSFTDLHDECSNIRGEAYNMFVTVYEREPTEDELEYEVESLMDRYR